MDGIRYYALLILETINGSHPIAAEDLMRRRDVHFPRPSARIDTSANSRRINADAAPYSGVYQNTYEPADRMTIRKGLDSADDCLLDQHALDECHKRIEHIDLEMAALEAKSYQTEADFARIDELNSEKEAITNYIKGGLVAKTDTGRTAPLAHFPNSGERARKAVDGAMRRARKRMEVHIHLRPFVEHLETSVEIGRWLSYNGSHNWRIEGLPSHGKPRS